jgi:hypothetical protein
MIKCEVQVPMRPKVCLGVKHILTSGGECKGWSPMTPKCTPTLGVALVWELWMFEALIRRQTSTKLGPHDTIKFFLKCRCLRCPRIVHLDLNCMSYDQRKGRKSNWDQPQIHWKQGSNEVQLERVIQHWKGIFEGYKVLPLHFQNKLDLRNIWASKILKQ